MRLTTDLKYAIAAAAFVTFGALAVWTDLIPGGAVSAERTLQARADAALAAAGQLWAQVSVEGRRATLSGEPPSIAAREAALDAVRGSTWREGWMFGGLTVVRDATGAVADLPPRAAASRAASEIPTRDADAVPGESEQGAASNALDATSDDRSSEAPAASMAGDEETARAAAAVNDATTTDLTSTDVADAPDRTLRTARSDRIDAPSPASPSTPERDADDDAVLTTPRTRAIAQSRADQPAYDACAAALAAAGAPGAVTFGFDSADPSAQSQAVLVSLAEALAGCPTLAMTIDGHTDNSGDPVYNRFLSARRAEAVRDRLITLGVAQDRLQARGWGDAQPLESNDTPAGRRANRRIAFRLLESLAPDADGAAPAPSLTPVEPAR